MRAKFLLAFLLIIPYLAISQIKFASGKAKNRFEKLPESCKNQINAQIADKVIPIDLSLLCNGVSNFLPLHIISSNNIIVHLGFTLFNDSISALYPKDVCRFLESLVLESAITGKQDFDKFLLESDIFVNCGISEKSSNYLSLKDCIDYKNSSSKFILINDSSKYCAIWDDGIKKLAIIFPAKNTLLTFMDKKELDELLYENLKELNGELKSADDVEIYEKQLIKDTGNIYILPGEQYFKGISSDIFYSRSDSTMKYSVLFDKAYFSESLNNLLLKPNKIGRNIVINLHQKQYGGIIKDILVNYSDLLNYLSSCKYIAFVGIENKNAENMAATVIFVNRKLNNLHLLYLETNISSLFSETISFDAKLYTNIPTDNIKNIFANYTELDSQYNLKVK